MIPLRLGLIGAGAWGRNYIRTLQAMDGLALARVATLHPPPPELPAAGCAVTPEWREVARAKDLDGVVIATPPRLHAEMARAAVEAGLPVLVEKPLAMSEDEARSLLELARGKNGFVLVDHVYLFHPAYQTLKGLAKTLGPVRSIRSLGGNRGPFRPDVPPLWDYGPHDLALCLDLLGTKPVRARAHCERSERTPEGLGQNWLLRLGFPGGAEAELKIGNLFREKARRFEVRFGKEILLFDDLAEARLTRNGTVVPLAYRPPLQLALEAFVNAVRSGSKDLSSLALGVEVVEVLAELRTPR